MYNLAQNQACITLRPALLGEVPEGRRGKGELKWKHFAHKKNGPPKRAVLCKIFAKIRSGIQLRGQQRM